MRRKLATDHKDGSLKVLCELGGWKSPKTYSSATSRRTSTASGRYRPAGTNRRLQPTPLAQLSNPARQVKFVTRCI